MRTLCRSRHLAPPYFAGAAVFIATGVNQAAFAALGVLFLALALAALARGRGA